MQKVGGRVMADKPRDLFYVSKEWLRARHSCLARAGFRCQHCGADVRGKGKALVHHIVPRRVAPHLSLVASNLLCLDKACHNRLHDKHNNGALKETTSINYAGFPSDGSWG